MKIVLILLNYNDYINTIKYIKFSQKYNNIDNIVVVDNCSMDNSFKILKKYENNKVSVIKTDKNGGYAYGNNFGILYAKQSFEPDYIIISNPDVSFEEDVVMKMVNALAKDKSLVMVAPQVRNNGDSKSPIAWKIPDYFGSICCISIILNKLFWNRNYYKLNHYEKEISYVDVIPGSFFMIKAKEFFQIGLFDENTFLYGEENIIAKKLKDKNYRSAILNDCIYYHEHSATIDNTFNTYSSRYDLLFKSLMYYNKTYLKTGVIKNIFFWVIFKVCNLEKLVLSIIKGYS